MMIVTMILFYWKNGKRKSINLKYIKHLSKKFVLAQKIEIIINNNH